MKVIISGRPCSGKTRLAHALALRLLECGREVTVRDMGDVTVYRPLHHAGEAEIVCVHPPKSGGLAPESLVASAHAVIAIADGKIHFRKSTGTLAHMATAFDPADPHRLAPTIAKAIGL